ncbi:hypothetical protein BU15DRAFT_60356 [Melanogaster broomeanus]|nr:hypothetical protein BU15DRAFT_60356 [Melanogaster broomeanus]
MTGIDRRVYSHKPWYLATFAVAERLYNAVIDWGKQGYIQVTSLLGSSSSRHSLTTGTYSPSSSTYTSLISAVQSLAVGFVAISVGYAPSDRGQAEQYSKDTETSLICGSFWGNVGELGQGLTARSS